MRLLWKLLILLALAIAGALLWQKLAADPGYLQLVWGGWSLETTLPVAIAVALLALALLLVLAWLIRLPFKGWKQARERRADMRKPGLTLDGQRDGPGLAVEQCRLQQLFEMADPLADRRLSQTGLVRGGREAAATRRRFEGADPFKRRHFERLVMH